MIFIFKNKYILSDLISYLISSYSFKPWSASTPTHTSSLGPSLSPSLSSTTTGINSITRVVKETLCFFSFLLKMMMDFVLRRGLCKDDGFVVACRRSCHRPAICLTCPASYDLLWPCRSTAANRSHREGERVGLRINITKTEALQIGMSCAPPLQLPNGDVIGSAKTSNIVESG